MSIMIDINLDRLLDIAFRGVRRASTFLAIGVNSARDPRIKDYQFPTEVPIRILPDGLDDKTIEHFKVEFEKWIILSGLRDLIETFAVFLDEVYKVGLLISINAGNMQPEDATEFERAFEWKGIEGKFNILKDQLGIETSKGKYLISISKTRNCLAHRRGIVSQRDVNSDGALHVVWWALDLFAETPEGKEISLMPPLPNGGIRLDEGGKVKSRFTDREREFHLGQVLELTTRDLAEICFLATIASREVISSVIAFSRDQGIVIKEREITTSNNTDIEEPTS